MLPSSGYRSISRKPISSNIARGRTNFVHPQNRYRQGALLYRYGYVDSDLSLNQLSFSLGYRYATYRKTK